MRYFFNCKPTLLPTFILLVLSSQTMAKETNKNFEHIAIFGDQNTVNDIPGSAHLISESELEKFDFTDIMRTLTAIPGVYILEEDGYGLRPNIGMRGTGQNRSEKVTIMEDGVLAAPAPYAAPSAYYFPTAGRMQQIEVLKGTSSAIYGPRTTGGVINLLSRKIPDETLSGELKVTAGEDNFAKFHAFAGGSGQNIASLVELFNYQADGFKNINHTNTDSGFEKNDILTKVKINSDPSSGYYQELEFKVKYSDEKSNDTYMGLTDNDFKTSPYSRYSASQLDNMTTTHKQLQINHSVKFSELYQLGTSFYYNDFARNWYKSNKIDGQSIGGEGIKIASNFDKANQETPLEVQIKANNRNYLSKGVQSILSADLNEHQVKFGIRYHQDEMDRYQWVDKYLLDNNYIISLTDPGIPGTDSNRVDSAKALAIYIHDEVSYNDFMINLGLRYEDMTIERHDWGKNDPKRGISPSYKVNKLDVWLPSVALTYRFDKDIVLLAGIQKGFAPPAPGNETAQDEESINYEMGVRLNKQVFHGEIISFYSDYNNMHGNCTASQGCEDDNVGNQYNAGEVKVTGLELKTGYEFKNVSFSIPLDFTYTYTQTEFLTDFNSNLDTWSNVSKGDNLPYVPSNQFQLSTGLVFEQWRSDVIIRYTDDMRTTAGTGTIPSEQLIKSRTVVDLSAHYYLTKNQGVTFAVDNLLDNEYISTRTHGSIMVGKPRTFSLGYKYQF
ncbi:TonB-dependent receptor family protein [Pseudoalteromonas denitrificans]|uniref:Fe(3+) dicitrate transport protein n=1 Tax=Pseudoalteromonas denitrificans DSM 6059 TaxID=1123010 RepID=A0A1I1FS00_9GAMM|nr:TonB-dependent receptor [Pseudoalteromonas denitrificans]SFC00418.1 Fe(3+) dicitrate transport protein [Pseudoalteromonas denitrificans DSM 6059]